ncbi:MAG: Uma2 family endonuclease [Chloroflexi bacterium]|nr:Uma2 family endonuclease [Chloroflexota bacterium]
MSAIIAIEKNTSDTASKKSLRMTYAEFRDWSGEDTHAEWVNGEVIEQMPPKNLHQNVVGFLYELLDLFVRIFQLGIVRVAPFEMRASPDGSAREPDILYIANEHRDRLTEERLAGPADLVIEVISDESVARDRADKFYEYELAGVREYWIIDPRPARPRADFYVLDAQMRYQPIPIDADGIYRSTVLPGFWMRVEWLWSANAPEPLRALAQMIGRAKIIAALGDAE